MNWDSHTKEELLKIIEQQASYIQQLENEPQQLHHQTIQQRSKLLDFVMDAVISSDTRMMITSWNRGAEVLYGSTEAEVLGKNAVDILKTIYPDGSTYADAFQQFDQNGVWRGNMIHHHRDGTSIPVVGSTTKIYSEDHEVLGFVTVIRDNRDVVQAIEALDESEHRYRIISQLMTDYAYLYHVNPDTNEWKRVWITEDAFQQVTGYHHLELEKFYHLYHPDERERVVQDIQRVLKGEDIDREYRIITKDGQEKWIYIRRRVLFDKAGNVMGFYGGSRDITIRKRAQEQEKLYLQEQERAQILYGFLRDASHDLKTPISTIMTSVYLIRKYATEEKQLSQIDKLDHYVQHLNHLIEDMLDMTRYDLINQVKDEPVNLYYVLQDSIGTYQKDADKKQIHLQADITSTSIYVRGDISALSKAMDNLVENAVHYTLEQGTVSIRTDINDDTVKIVITDTGIGIEPEHLPHIFDRFYRVDQSRKINAISSTGLGLSITRKIIELHQGDISVRSQVGVGTTVTVTLPLTLPD